MNMSCRSPLIISSILLFLLIHPSETSVAVEHASSQPILLWPGGAPGAKGMGEEDKPSIRIYQPAQKINTGVAVIICPGGGYHGLAISHEGTQVAKWFNSFGVTGVVLKYRLGPQYHHPIELQDAQRAMRYVRANAEQLGIHHDKIGIMGFSAGGHLASTVATHFDTGNKHSADSVERFSCRPDFAILAYAVISFQADITHKGSVRNLLGNSPKPEIIKYLSNEKQVTKQTPPTFLFHTSEDKAVSAQNSIRFYSALLKKGIQAELHIYRYGPHGVGLASGNPILSTWTDRLKDWMKNSGILKQHPRAAVKGKITFNGKEINRRLSIVFLHENRSELPAVVQMIRNGQYSFPEKTGPFVGKTRIEIWDRDSEQAQKLAFTKNLSTTIMPGKNVMDFDIIDQ